MTPADAWRGAELLAGVTPGDIPPDDTTPAPDPELARLAEKWARAEQLADDARYRACLDSADYYSADRLAALDALHVGHAVGDVLDAVVPKRCGTRARAVLTLNTLKGLGCSLTITHGALVVRPVMAIPPDVVPAVADLSPWLCDLLDEGADP